VGNYLQVNTASYIRRPESLLRLLYRLSWWITQLQLLREAFALCFQWLIFCINDFVIICI
jgi:hypothetical protein